MSEHIKQVGGDHYEAPKGAGHWDLCSRWDLEYLPAMATKYVMRWDLKGTPILDLEKAISYLEKQLAVHPDRGCIRFVPEPAMDEFFHDNGLRPSIPIEAEKRLILELVHVHGTRMMLKTAIACLENMLEREKEKVLYA